MIRFAVLTISDRSASGNRPDSSGPALVKKIKELGWNVVENKIIPDDLETIKTVLVNWCDLNTCDIILTTGGTGFSSRDVTPEATLTVIDRQTPGLAEVMRMESLKTTAHAMLSRAVAGIRGRTLIINLPGSPKGAVENLMHIAHVLEHAVEVLQDRSSAEAGHNKNPIS